MPCACDRPLMPTGSWRCGELNSHQLSGPTHTVTSKDSLREKPSIELSGVELSLDQAHLQSSPALLGRNVCLRVDSVLCVLGSGVVGGPVSCSVSAVLRFKLLFSVQCLVSDNHSGSCQGRATPTGCGHSYRSCRGKD